MRWKNGFVSSGSGCSRSADPFRKMNDNTIPVDKRHHFPRHIMARPRIYHIQLSKKERRIIKHFQKRTGSANARTRCAILLAADPDGHREKSYGEISVVTDACTATVIRTLKEFLDVGFTKMITAARNPRSNTGSLKVIGDIEARRS